MKIALLLLLFVAAASAQTANPDPVQFFAQVVRQQGTGANAILTYLSGGVVTRTRHIVTLASLLRDIPREELRVHLQTTAYRGGSDIRTVEWVYEHPDFLPANPAANNIAVLRLSYSAVDLDNIQPRNLGALTAVECRIFGFDGWNTVLTTHAVNVTNVGCTAPSPFCTTFEAPSLTCGGGFVGTPVICANQAYVAGIANVEAWCAQPPIRSITFLNLEPFHGWIDDVSGAKTTAQVSIFIVLLGVALGKFLL